MKKITCLFCFILFSNSLFCQVPSTDIFLVDVQMKDGKYEFGVPVNITHHEGYDNQPSFTSDGMRILYASMPDTSQTDVFIYSIKDSTTKRVTKTAESEYSPVLLPDDKHISVIRVDSGKAQHFYKIDLNEKESPVTIVTGTDSAAYYAWINSKTVAMCVLNNIMNLHIYDLTKEQYIKLSSNVGRCLVKFPGSEDLCFIQNGMGTERTIMRYTNQSGSMYTVGPALKGSEDFTILPGGQFLMGAEGKLFLFDEIKGTWDEIADFSKTAGNFYRLVASPDGKRIALVSYIGKKP